MNPVALSGGLVPAPPDRGQAIISQRSIQAQPGHAAVGKDVQPHVGGWLTVDPEAVQGVRQQPDPGQQVPPGALVGQRTARRVAVECLQRGEVRLVAPVPRRVDLGQADDTAPG